MPARHRGRYGDPLRRRTSGAELEVIELDVEHRRYEADAAGTLALIEIVRVGTFVYDKQCGKLKGSVQYIARMQWLSTAFSSHWPETKDREAVAFKRVNSCCKSVLDLIALWQGVPASQLNAGILGTARAVESELVRTDD